MKRMIILVLLTIGALSGCTSNVNGLIEKGQYEEALAIIEEAPDKYADLYDEVRYKVAEKAFENNEFEKVISLVENNQYEGASTLLADTKYNLASVALQNNEFELAIAYLENNTHEDADELLAHTYELKAAYEIETFYNEMLTEIEEYNPDKWNSNFDYMDGTDFYLRISDLLNETYDIIIRDNKIDNAKEMFTDIFGYEPETTAQAKDAIQQLTQDMGFEKFYDSPFSYYQCLYYVMDTLTKHSDYVRFEMTNTSGFMVIEQPYQFLQDKGISTKTFAYLLGTCKDMGAEIERDAEKIIVTFENVQSDSYYSRGYFYCAPNSQHDELLDFYSKLGFSIDSWGLDEVGVWMDITVSNPGKHKLKYLSIDGILINVNGEHLETASVLLKNVSDTEITFTLDFYDVTMDELIEKNCSVEFFPAVVFNN